MYGILEQFSMLFKWYGSNVKKSYCTLIFLTINGVIKNRRSGITIAIMVPLVFAATSMEIDEASRHAIYPQRAAIMHN